MVDGAETGPDEKSSENPKVKSDQESAVQKEIAKFVDATDSLLATSPLTLWVMESAHRNASQELSTFARTKCDIVRQQGETLTANVPPGLVHEYRVLKRRVDRSRIASKVIAHSSVVSLISQYDSFLGGLVRALFYLRPELLNASDTKLTFKDLQTFNSIGAAGEFIVEKEVEILIRKSHLEQFEWMENKFGVKLREGLEVWPRFIEVTERRNLLVHGDGIVSSQYLTICRQHGVNCDGVSVGTELAVTRAYITSAYECLVEVGVKLAHVLWRKLVPNELDVADENLNWLCLDLMTEGRNTLAAKLLDFSVGVLKKHKEVNRLLFVLNRAQAYKWLNDKAMSQKILAEEDWSAVDDKMLLGLAVLEDDFVKASALMKKTAESSTVPKEAYLQWPIFKQFIKSPEFKQAYKQIFGEECAEAPEQNIIFKVGYQTAQQTQQKAPGSGSPSKPN